MRRYLVDVMNVIGSRPDRWWSNRDRALRTMVSKLDAYAGAAGLELTAVLDSDPGGLPPVEHIDIVVARRKGRDAADHEIEQLVASDPEPEDLVVVTSDKALIDAVTDAGAEIMPAGRFRDRLERRG